MMVRQLLNQVILNLKPGAGILPMFNQTQVLV